MSKNKEKISKEEKVQQKLDAKREKALARKSEINDAVKELKQQIADETDEKQKKKLRSKRDELLSERDAINNSKDGMTIPMPRKTRNVIRAVVAVVVVVAILSAYIVSGTVRHGMFARLGITQNIVTAFTIEDADGNKHNIDVTTYNYYYAMQYNQIRNLQSQYSQYGLDLSSMNLDVDFDQNFKDQTTKNDDDETVTWAEFMVEEVEENIKNTYLYYYEAVKANNGKEPEIEEDQQKEIDDTLKEYEDSGKKYGYTLSGYLSAAMGKGVTEEVFRRETKISYIADNYKSKISDDFNNTEYSDEQYKKYKDDNYDDLVSVDVKYFECDSADEAKKFVKALKADGSNFAELASKYSAEKFDKEANKNDVETTYVGMTRPVLRNIGSAIGTADKKDSDKYPGLDWLFSNKRKAGDIKQFTTSVVYVIKPVYMSDVKPVTVRHILIAPEDKDNADAKVTEMSKDKWDAAYKKAKKILDEYNKGDKTAATFGELAKTNSTDSNKDQGGIYENVTPNQMVPSFNAWCFDSARKAGDTAIVKTKFGYHIMYFESRNNLPVWKYTAQQSIASEDNEKVTDKLEKSYSISLNKFGQFFFQDDRDF